MVRDSVLNAILKRIVDREIVDREIVDREIVEYELYSKYDGCS
jgi:hypothetical protein